MLDLHALKPEDLRGLSHEAVAQLAERLLVRIAEQAKAMKFKDTKIERILFELARLKRWKFAAKTERMNAEQRQMFEEAMAEDQASLEAQLEALQAKAGKTDQSSTLPADKDTKGKPRRQALPEHLRRVVYHHEPENTDCPSSGCGQPMVRIGEDITERLDIVPAEFFVHHHIRGKWACKCCQILVQEPVAPQIIDKGMPSAGLLAHVAVSRFVDHIPYFRQEHINARSGVHTPRSTLASWNGQTGASLLPLFDAHRDFVLGSQVLHVDETPVAMLDPGAGKTKRAYVWAYARSAFDPVPGVAYDFRASRAARHPAEFLKGWSGTLVCDGYGVYENVVKLEERTLAACAAHARRKFEELIKDKGHSPVAAQALQRIARIYRIEREIKELSPEDRLAVRQERSAPLWAEMHVWLKLERQSVPDGSPIAQAVDYSLNRWDALTRNLYDGDVPVDNNHCENQIRPWAMGRKAWLFAGSELAGQRAAVIMSLLQSAKLCGHDPWAYLKDVLERLPTQLNSRIEELLPHLWKPAADR